MNPSVLSYTPQKVVPMAPRGVITHVGLRTYDVDYIKLALTGLAEHIHKQTIPAPLTVYRPDQLTMQWRYLEFWLDKPALQQRLRKDSSNVVWWPVTISEVVDWLLPICQHCVTEDAVFVAAIERAEQDVMDYSEGYENDHGLLLADELVYQRVRGYQNYFDDVIQHAETKLIDQLHRIQAQDYPLFPTLSLSTQ